MFEFIKKLLGIGTQEQKTAGKKPGKKKHSGSKKEKSSNNKDFRSREKSSSPKPEGKKNRSKEKKHPQHEEKNFAAPVEKVEHPAALREVAPAEGKIRFLDLPLHTEVQFGVQHAGFEYCTPIQKLTLPAVLAGRDIAGKAQTGTGKTAAFLLGGCTKMLNEPLKGERKNGTAHP